METSLILRFWFLVPLVLLILGLFLAAVSSGSPKKEEDDKSRKKPTLAFFDQ